MEDFLLSRSTKRLGIELEVLKQLLPEIIQEMRNSQANQSKRPYEISLGLSEKAVLASTPPTIAKPTAGQVTSYND
jgi:hypothetical protein